MAAKVLVFAGSLRRDSFNKKLARLVTKDAIKAGAEATFIDLADFPLPIFDEDVEKAGTPEAALRLKKIFLDHDALIICSPEYNSSITAALKNAIDWVSRSAPGEGSLAAFQGKVALLLAASPGALGGLRGLVHLRSILGNIGVTVLPGQYALSKAQDAFDDQGALKDSKVAASFGNLVGQLVATTSKLKAS